MRGGLCIIYKDWNPHPITTLVFADAKNKKPPLFIGGWRIETIQREIARLILYIRQPSNQFGLELFHPLLKTLDAL